MLNSLEERLERIEGSLEALGGKLDELLKRKKRPTGGKTKAQVHDEAVKSATYAERASLPWLDAWNSFCDARRDAHKYLTENAINALWKKLDAFPVAEQIRALNDSVANGWSGVFPKECETVTDQYKEW